MKNIMRVCWNVERNLLNIYRSGNFFWAKVAKKHEVLVFLTVYMLSFTFMSFHVCLL
jgi:hypothetical protein